MSHAPSSYRKRKAVEEPEVATNRDDQTPKDGEALRMSLDSMTLSQIASLHRNAPLATERVGTASKPSASNAREHKASMGRIRETVQDLSGSGNVEVNAALVALSMDVKLDATTRDNIVAADGCHALVQLLKNCLEKGIAGFPACDQVTELIELAELTILHNALLAITNLTYRHVNSRVCITAIGGVEAAIKVMKTFPKCQTLQERACAALLNLMCNNVTGKKRAIESDGIKIVLAAINNHLGSSILCRASSVALFNMILGIKKNTELLKCLGGGAAIFKVRAKWPDIDENCDGLLDYLTAQMTASQPSVRRSYKTSDVAISFPPVAPEDTAASPKNPTISSQSTLGMNHESSHGVSPSPKVPAVHSKPRNDSQLKPEATLELLSRQPENDRNYNCKSTEALEAVPGRYDRKCKNTVTIFEATGEGGRNATRVVNRNAEPKDQIQSIGMVIQDLFYSDNITFDAALHALHVELVEDSTKWEHFVTVGGCFAVVPIMWLVVKEMLRWISKESV
jgi:hypothetical protein